MQSCGEQNFSSSCKMNEIELTRNFLTRTRKSDSTKFVVLILLVRIATIRARCGLFDSYACFDVAWSVCLSVCVSHVGELYKTAEPIDMPLGGRVDESKEPFIDKGTYGRHLASEYNWTNRTEQNIFICLNKVTQFTTHRKHNRQAARKVLWLNNAGGPNSNIHQHSRRRRAVGIITMAFCSRPIRPI